MNPAPRAGLAVPDGAVAAVLVVSGANGGSPLAMLLADVLHVDGLATFVVSGVADGGARRVAAALAWMGDDSRLRDLPTGCLALREAIPEALTAISADPERVHALVVCGNAESLGDGPDLVTPTLVVVGALDGPGLAAGRAMVRGFAGPSELAVIEDTQDPVNDRGALGTVAWLTSRWFTDHLSSPS